MTTAEDTTSTGASMEERAEELVQRATSAATRFLTVAVERTREEIEDIVAEAQELRRGEHTPDA
jgi:vacuolar-type H+-ATPase subunit H